MFHRQSQLISLRPTSPVPDGSGGLCAVPIAPDRDPAGNRAPVYDPVGIPVPVSDPAGTMAPVSDPVGPRAPVSDPNHRTSSGSVQYVPSAVVSYGSKSGTTTTVITC